MTRSLPAAPTTLWLAIGLLVPQPTLAGDSPKRKGSFEPEGRSSLRQFVQMDDQRVPVEYPESPDEAAATKPLGVVPAITTLDADLRLRRIQGTGLGFLLDFEYRHDMTDALSDPLPLADNRLKLGFGPRRDRSLGRLRGDLYVKSAYAEYEGMPGGFDLRLGRMLMYEQGQTWVDGAHLVRPPGGARGERGFGAGVYGGLSPNPMTYTLDGDYIGGGGHLNFEADGGFLSLASTYTQFQGKKDRAFLNSSGHWQLVEGLFASYNATIDFFAFKEVEEGLAVTTKPQITSAFANLAWWATPHVQFRLSGALYRNVVLVGTYRESLDGALADLIDDQEPNSSQLANAQLAQSTYDTYLGRFVEQAPYTRGLFTSVFKFLGHLYAYNEVGLRHRDRDDSAGSTVGFGIRNTHVFGSGAFMHARIRFNDAFASDTGEGLLELRRQLGGLLTASVSASHLAGRSLAINPDIDIIRELGANTALRDLVARLNQRQDVTMLAADIDIDITDRLFMSLAYELTVETPTDEERDGSDAKVPELNIQAFTARLTWRL